MRNRVRVMCKPGSEGGRGGQPPQSTRPEDPVEKILKRSDPEDLRPRGPPNRSDPEDPRPRGPPVRSGRPYGAEDWVEVISHRLGIVREPRRRGRPPREKML